MASLSRDDVAHVAHLARLGLTEEELSRLEGQLNHILEQYAVLAELDTDHIAPTAQTIELENILRDDVVTPSFTRRRGPGRRPGAGGGPHRRAGHPGRGGMSVSSDDLTGLYAHELASALRAGETTAREILDASLGPHPCHRPRPPRLGLPGRRSCRGRGRCRRSALPGRAWGRGGGHGRAAAAARHPGRAQGPRRHQGSPLDGREPHPRGLRRPLRCPHRRAAGRGRRRHPRQDEHGRVRHGLLDRALGLGPDRQPVGPRARARRLERWFGGGGGRPSRAARHRHRHRRLHPPAGRAVRRRRHEADLRPRQPLRHHRLRLLPRPDRAVRARRA